MTTYYDYVIAVGVNPGLKLFDIAVISRSTHLATALVHGDGGKHGSCAIGELSDTALPPRARL